MFHALWEGVTEFVRALAHDLAPSFRTGGESASSATPPPDVAVDDTGGGGGSGGGGDTSDGGGGSDTSDGFGGDTGINWSDTGWSGWSDWDTAYPYVETEDQTCFAEEKYKKPVCYAKGGREQERETIVQGLKCSTSPEASLPLAELGLLSAFAIAVVRVRR